MKSRIFNIMQYKNHPETFEPLLSEDQIKVALAHKTIKRYAYILHDKDHYSEKDFDDDPKHSTDKIKPDHWHIVIECSQQIEIHTIAKWFGIAENFVDKAHGAGAFLDCVEYLTHEETKQQEQDKHHYDDSEVHSNFDFREELTKRAERRLKYGKDLDEKSMILLDIQNFGLSMHDAFKRDPLIYAQNLNLFQRARSTWLANQPAPDLRLNFYVWSKHGGDGKGLASRAIARSMFPNKEDDEVFFHVNKDTMFNGYDGQPVLIWNDFRAVDLLNACGGRGNLFDIFDTHPVKQLRNVKYSTVALINQVNIVNSVQNYREFLDGLAGEYTDRYGDQIQVEDKTQAYRRFPMIMEVRLDSYEYMINAGFLDDERSYLEFESHKAVKAGFKQLNEKLAYNSKLLHELESKALLPFNEKIQALKDKLSAGQITEEEAEKMFHDLGKEIEPVAVPVINELTENLLDEKNLVDKAQKLIKDIKFKFDHDTCHYDMTPEEQALVLAIPEGAALLVEILRKYGPDAIAISDGDPVPWL